MKTAFGSEASIYKLKALQSNLSVVESYLVDAIEENSLKEFIFISALASATSYLNQNIGEFGK
jgi:2-dehydropantoate 2-reductase